MSSNQDLKNLQAKVIGDTGFRARFLRDPLAVAACLGIALNATQVAAANDVHQKIEGPRQEAFSPTECAVIVTFPRVVSTPHLLPRQS